MMLTTNKHPISFSETKNGKHSDGDSIDNISFYMNGYKTTEGDYSDNFSSEKQHLIMDSLFWNPRLLIQNYFIIVYSILVCQKMQISLLTDLLL